jgi:5'-nucleotidase
VSRPLIIAVDVDEVVADLLTEWLRRYNAKYNDNLTVDKVRGWEMAPQTKPECREKIYEILREPDLYDHVWPIPGTLGAIERLRRLGRVVFVSAKNGTAKLEWLQKWGYLPDGDDNDFIMAKDKALVKADYLFDDHIKNVESFPGCGVLVDHWHNRDTKTWRPRIKTLADAPLYITTRYQWETYEEPEHNP